MIRSSALLKDLQAQVTRLQDALRTECDRFPASDGPLKERYTQAQTGKRTSLTYKAWREEELTQIAVGWVLATVFVRFLEDNGLVETLYLAGADADGLRRSGDERVLLFNQHPQASDLDYLRHVLTATMKLPAMAGLLEEKRNPLWEISRAASPDSALPDAITALLQFWRKSDPQTGSPVHGFSPAAGASETLNAPPSTLNFPDTRFLGDLYQDLSESARKKYALLQTPEFIETFILDRTLTPAIESFGFSKVRMIDPTCGSGHFCLGGFHRLFRLWQEAEPASNPRVLAQKALDGIFGVDLNPFAVAIARFRLLIAALGEIARVEGRRTLLKHAPDLRFNLAVGDSLLHGRRFTEYGTGIGSQPTLPGTYEEVFRDELKHHYEVEDVEALHRILGQQYHAIVGNPPYITVKDRAVSDLYRARFPSCHRQYSLSVPFMERFFDLAVKGDGTPQQPAGFTGQITANSFMKREFGKKLIEEYLPRWDLTHVLDTAGAYIPGMGTPTVILFGKNQPPVSGTIRTVLGIAGEPATPDDPSQGVVWQAILRQIDEPGSVSEWMSAADSPRASFHRHPWSIGGGGAAELKDVLDEAGSDTLGEIMADVGRTTHTGADEVFYVPPEVATTRALMDFAVPLVIGEDVRDHGYTSQSVTLFPYDKETAERLKTLPAQFGKYIWPCRTVMRVRKDFGQFIEERGLCWWEHSMFFPKRYRAPLGITFGEVATHNHFVLDRGGKVFKQTAPIITLKEDATESDHVRLLGVLNSSTACFYLKQVCHNKGSTVDEHGARQRTAPFEDFYAFNGTKLAILPIPKTQPTQLPTALVQTSTALQGQSPAATLASWGSPESGDLRPWLASARDLATRQRRQLIAWQEELDWQIYEAFGLVDGAAESDPAAVSLPEGDAVDAILPEGLELGQRPFEIVLARRMAAGEAQSTWFERHGSTPITEVPRHWPAGYRELVERRIACIESDPNIRLIEQPEYKRRWNTESWDAQFQTAAKAWLLARLEGYFHEGQRVCELKDGFSPAAAGFAPATRPALTSTNQLAGTAQTDAAFLAVAEQLMGGPGYSVPKLVRELVESASVPFLPAQRYKPSGLLKRHDWEQVWDLQREEDRLNDEIARLTAQLTTLNAQPVPDPAQIEALNSQLSTLNSQLPQIPVPPKYASTDFKKPVWWSLRGKLDVPKERWVLYSGTERTEDPSPVIAWAGWDHAQQALALAEYYLEARDTHAFPPEKLKLLLAGLQELLSWLHQWHHAIDPTYGDSPANAIQAFLQAEMHSLAITPADLEKVRMG